MADNKQQAVAGTLDSDNDGLTDEVEHRLGTDPHKWDTDGDGMTDGTEVNSFGTDPKLADTDGDGLGDDIETWIHTDPTHPDTDGDGFGDGFEVAVGEHPRVKDLDGVPADRAKVTADLVVGMEEQIGVTQHNVDTDGDGFADWVEAMHGGGDPKVDDMTENMVQANPTSLDRFVDLAQQQTGAKYQFGAEVEMNDRAPQAFDSSELVQWTAHQAGVEIPDGSWNQYRHLHEQGATISVDDALKTKGALVFGFSSDPLASPDRPARAYVGISLGNGKVIDVSERAGEVRELDAGDFYTHAAVIPEFIPDLPDTPGHPLIDQMLHPTSPLQPDTDGDGMLDVDERVTDRDPFDDSDGTPSTERAADEPMNDEPMNDYVEPSDWDTPLSDDDMQLVNEELHALAPADDVASEDWAINDSATYGDDDLATDDLDDAYASEPMFEG